MTRYPTLAQDGYRLEGISFGTARRVPLSIEWDREWRGNDWEAHEVLTDVNHRLVCSAGVVSRGAPVLVVIHADPRLVQYHARAVDEIVVQLGRWGYRKVSLEVKPPTLAD